MGDLPPTSIKPFKKPHCAVVGTLILVAIAVAVAAVTAGAAVAAFTPAMSLMEGIAAVATGTAGLGGVAAGALDGAVGSIVSQGVGVATHLQDKFSWKSVAMAGISGGVAAGVAAGAASAGLSFGNAIVDGAVRGAVSNAATQGIEIAAKMQHGFSWTGVAVGAVAGGVTAAVGDVLGIKYDSHSLSSYAQQAVAGLAGGIAGAATRSALTGTSFVRNLEATLPDAIGNTIGTMMANAVAGKPRSTSGAAEQAPGQPATAADSPAVEGGALTPQQQEEVARQRLVGIGGDDKVQEVVKKATTAAAAASAADPIPDAESFQVGNASVGYKVGGTGSLSLDIVRQLGSGTNLIGALGEYSDWAVPRHLSIGATLAGETTDAPEFESAMGDWLNAAARIDRRLAPVANDFQEYRSIVISGSRTSAAQMQDAAHYWFGTGPGTFTPSRQGSAGSRLGAFDYHDIAGSITFGRPSPSNDGRPAASLTSAHPSFSLRRFAIDRLGDPLSRGLSSAYGNTLGSRGFKNWAVEGWDSFSQIPHDIAEIPSYIRTNGILNFIGSFPPTLGGGATGTIASGGQVINALKSPWWRFGGAASEGGEKIVYRALSSADVESLAAGQGLTAKAVNGTWSAAEHVANAGAGKGGAALNSPWISTTRSLDTARIFNREGNGIVAIDLSKVSSAQVEVWKNVGRTGTTAIPYQRSIFHQEVTVFQSIPSDAIVGVRR